MSRSLVSVALAMLVLTLAMGLKTAAISHGDASFIMANGSAPAPMLSQKNGPDPLPTPWKCPPDCNASTTASGPTPASLLSKNGPDPLPSPWKTNGPDPLPSPWKNGR